MLPDIREALEQSPAKILLALNLTSDAETTDMSHGDHIKSFVTHSGGQTPDIVIADPSAIDELWKLDEAVKSIGAGLILRQIHTASDSGIHDALRFAAALRDVFEGSITDLDQADKEDNR